MKVARRIDKLPPYLFVEINRKIAEKKAKGEEIISFAIGDPDIPTPEGIINRLCEAAREPVNHRYPETVGLPEFRQAVAGWYRQRFDVALDPKTEVLSLIGSKEGIFHIAFCYLDEGDTALVPDPGYPVYAVSVSLAGGNVHYMPLKEENGFLPDFSSIPEEVLNKARLLWVNYPNNPTGAVAGLDFFEIIVSLARKYDILVCHDAAYTEVAYDGYRPVSFLQAEGAKDVGVEFHSLSKSFNMTGWRIGMAAGNANALKALGALKSNLDSGISQAVQQMGIKALSLPQSIIDQRNEVYTKRRDLVLDVLRGIDLAVTTPKAGLYVWARVPEGYSSMEFTTDLLEQVGVAVTPGTGYGQSGEGYVRLSLTVPDPLLVKGLSRLSGWRNTRVLKSKNRKR
ncbi:LL-diaminopimelate aminotransferase [Chloroflexota bacterium]